jgi:hypothetical protein
MKNTKIILIAALAGVAITLSSSAAQEQVKGGERLQQINGSAFVPTAAASKAMACATCQDKLTTTPDVASPAAGARALVAAGVPAKAAVTHQCAACATTVTVANLGKHSPADAVTHSCASCNTEAPAAVGMEQMPGMGH